MYIFLFNFDVMIQNKYNDTAVNISCLREIASFFWESKNNTFFLKKVISLRTASFFYFIENDPTVMYGSVVESNNVCRE